MTRIDPIELRDDAPDETRRPAPLWHRAVAATLKTLVPLALLGAAALAAWQIMNTAPSADREARPRIARLVEVVEIAPAMQGPVIEGWGAVEAARTLALSSEVAGRITELHPDLVTGGEIEAGELVFAIDDRTARQALAEAQAAIAGIEARIRIERGQAARAASDLRRVPSIGQLSEEQRALVLREPQMAELEAELDAAVAAREQAEIALEKTRVTAPFDALVVETGIAPGTRLSVGTEVATLVPVDRFEVRIALPTSALDWLEIGRDEPVRLSQPGIWPAGAARTGTVERVAPRLRPSARMAEVIAVVEDPMARDPANAGKPPLLIGSFLKAEIEGREVGDAVALDRAAVRDGDRVWIMTPEDTLEIREIEIAWRGADRVLVTGGLAAGERVVTTPLATVSEGMALRTEGAEPIAAGPTGATR